MSMPPEPRVISGEVVALRLFEIAYAIDLARVEALWAERAGASARRSRLSTARTKALAFDVPPVEVSLGAVPLALAGESVSAAATARIYDFGVVALALHAPADGREWSGFARLLDAMDRAVGPDALAGVWPELLARVRSLLAPAFTRPSDSALQEDYLLGVVHEWSEPLTAAEVEERVDLAALLSGESRALSPGARRDILRSRFSYYADDLVVLTWDRAFIYEPRRDSDVADVLEVANAQLLELRYYDALLDDELPTMYDQVAEAQRGLNLASPRRFALLARRFYTLVAEVTELTEKSGNALQVTEDVYLARVYSAALDVFRVPTLSAAVDRKLAIVRDTYAALYEEASTSRAGFMELAIVLLIVIEIVLALIGH